MISAAATTSFEIESTETKPEIPESYLEQAETEHVIFVIHGMGQQPDKFAQNIGYLRKATEEIMEKFDGKQRVSFIPIEWHVKLHCLPSVDERVQSINLPTVPLLRVINNKYVADVVYYTTKYHGKIITDICIDQMNAEYKRLQVRGFNGTVSVLGHSLGGIISYDILCHQHWMRKETRKIAHPHNNATLPHTEGCGLMPGYDIKSLDFIPANLFLLGSPVASMIVMRGQSFNNYRIPEQIRFFNIFHPYDPFGYRFEPLVDPRFSDEEPVVLEHVNNNRFKLPDFAQVKARLSTQQIYPEFFAMPDFSLISSARDILSKQIAIATQYVQNITQSDSDDEETRKRVRMEAEMADGVTVEQPSAKPTQSLKLDDDLADYTSLLVRAGLSDLSLPSVLEMTAQFAQQVASSFVNLVKPTTPPLSPPLAPDAFEPASEVRQTRSRKNKRKREKEADNSTILEHRFDYVLQINMLENMSHEYLTGLPAHFSYWAHKDLVYFITKTVFNN